MFLVSHFFRSFIFLNTFLVSNIVHFVAPTSQPSQTFTVTVRSRLRSHRHRAKSPSPCEVSYEVVVTVRSCLATVACCFYALRLLASPCEVAYEVTPSLCCPHCPSLIRFLHLKVNIWTLTTHYCCFVEWVKLVVVLLQELSVIDVGVKTAKVSFWFSLIPSWILSLYFLAPI